jgi:hypothetical protein
VEKLNARGMSLPNILKLVAENSDFLAEQQLKELLGPYIDKEKMLVKMDRVFTVSNRPHFQFYFAFPFKSLL